MSDMKYGEASLQAREYFASKVKRQLNKNVTDYGLRFIKLTTLIPNWETYLTPKQREAALRYIKCMNAYEVDYQLNLSLGTTHQRLFGNKNSKGAIGRLEEVYKMLESNGYFEEKKKQKEAVNQAKKNKVRLTEKSLQSIKELFKLIVEIPDYEKYLTKSQKEKVDHLMRTRSLVAAARACGVTVKSYKQALIGEGGILDKLRKVNQDRTVNSWDEI